MMEPTHEAQGSPCVTIDEVKLSELTEYARMGIALHRITQAGFEVCEMRPIDGQFGVWVQRPGKWPVKHNQGNTWAEAAEKAADWCEKHKEDEL